MSVVDDKDFHELEHKLNEKIRDKDEKIEELEKKTKELMEFFKEYKIKPLNTHEKQKTSNIITIRTCVLAIILTVSSVKLDSSLLEKIEKILEVIIK